MQKANQMVQGSSKAKLSGMRDIRYTDVTEMKFI